MTHQQGLSVFFIFLFSLVVFWACSENEAVEERPNIILVMADDQGWGDMGYNGHPVIQTPNFDQLAANGLRFDRFYASAPVCSPTRGSVLTGRNPNRFGCFSWGYSLRPQEVTIAEALREAGYVTGHFGKWHVGSVFAGSPVNPGASGFDAWLSSPNFYENDPTFSREGIPEQLKGESSMVTARAALDFVRTHAESDKPIFAVVWFGSPHQPHIASAEDSAVYAGEPARLRNFYGEITGMDRAMGLIRQELKEMGMDQNTVLWYCSDNGGLPRFGTTGGRGHKSQIYEGGLRVPAIVEWPAKIKQPAIINTPSNTFDIYPTLLEIAGVDVPEQPVLDGISLLPVFEGKTKDRIRPMGFWQYPMPGKRTASAELMNELVKAWESGKTFTDSSQLLLNSGDLSVQYPEDYLPGHAAWLNWPWKLHRILKGDGEPVIEFYNLEEDSLEQNNLADTEAERVAAMLQQLETWQVSVVQSMNGKDYR